MASIFLSYSREDAAKADRIAHALEAAGLRSVVVAPFGGNGDGVAAALPAKKQMGRQEQGGSRKCKRGNLPADRSPLGTFSRVEEAFRAMESDEAIDAYGGSVDAFFRIHMRSIYSDPRFMRVAQRLGLLDYWQSSGRWPDFCSEPRLPYDCKKVAAQLGSAKAS